MIPIIKITRSTVIINPTNIAIIQTTIAIPNPVSCREFIITHDKIHPKQGIQPTNAIIKAVTKTSPKSVCFALFTTDNAIFKNNALISSDITITNIMNMTSSTKPKPKVHHP